MPDLYTAELLILAVIAVFVAIAWLIIRRSYTAS